MLSLTIEIRHPTKTAYRGVASRAPLVDSRHENDPSDPIPDLLIALISDCRISSAQKVAITFDDLPLNGDLPPGVTRVQIARDTLAVLKKWHVPASVWIRQCEETGRQSDAAEALKIWAAAEPFGESYIRTSGFECRIPRKLLSGRSKRTSRPWSYWRRRTELALAALSVSARGRHG